MSKQNLRIGIIGYSPLTYEHGTTIDSLDDIDTALIVEEQLDEVISVYDDGTKNIQIVSHGLNCGIDKLAYDLAFDRFYETMAITSFEIDEEFYDVDDHIVVHSSKVVNVFIDNIDILIRIGHSDVLETYTKVELAQAKGIPVIEFDL